MNADDVAVGMVLEARGPGPDAPWRPAEVVRRLAPDGRFRGLFEVRTTFPDGQQGRGLRYAEDLRPAPHHCHPPAEGQAVSRIEAASGGSVAVWPAGGGDVAVEVRVDGRGVRVLVKAACAGRVARDIIAGSAFYLGGPGASVWTEQTQYGTVLIASAPPLPGSLSVLLGRRAASLLAGLIDAAAAAESRSLAAALLSSDPDWGKKVIADALRRRDAAPGERGPQGDGFAELPPGLHEKAWRTCRAADGRLAATADPLAGARRRTDDNLRRAFGHD